VDDHKVTFMIEFFQVDERKGSVVIELVQVDDRKVTYKEVATLLRGCGIDLDHNRFLILQVKRLVSCVSLIVTFVISLLFHVGVLRAQLPGQTASTQVSILL